MDNLILLNILLATVCSTLGVRLSGDGGKIGVSYVISKEVEEGKPSNLTCNIRPHLETSSSKPIVVWNYLETLSATEKFLVFYQGKIVRDFEGKVRFFPPSTIELSSPTLSSFGFYECTVTLRDDRPNHSSLIYNITVIIPPSVPQCEYPNRNYIIVGLPVEIHCTSQGYPLPTYQWYKNDEELPFDGENVIASNTSASYNSQTGILSFSKVSFEDAGTYYCKATNKLGSQSCSSARLVPTYNLPPLVHFGRSNNTGNGNSQVVLNLYFLFFCVLFALIF